MPVGAVGTQDVVVVSKSEGTPGCRGLLAQRKAHSSVNQASGDDVVHRLWEETHPISAPEQVYAELSRQLRCASLPWKILVHSFRQVNGGTFGLLT